MRSKDSIDETNRKPRQFRGTPAFKVRNSITYAVIAYAIVAGACFIFSPLTKTARHNFQILSEARKYESEDESPEEKAKNLAMFQAFNTLLWRDQVEEVAGTET